MRRGSDLDEPVDLIDDEWRGATEVTPTKGRRRWPEALLAVAALAVVVGIGATSGGEADDATEMPRTTSTTVRRTTTTTSPRPTVTTTTWPREVAGSGPVLGEDAEPTRTALVVAERDEVAVIDLDTGDLCRTDDRGTGPWYVQAQGTLAPEVQLQDESGHSLVVDARCDLRPHPIADGAAWTLARTSRSAWTMDDGPRQRLVERAHDGEVMRTIEVPAFNGMVANDRWLVVNVAGELAAISLTDERIIGLGSGHPMAIGGGRVLAFRCESLDCGLVSIDIESRRARGIDVPTPTPWETSALSPDGRWLAYGAAEENGTIQPTLADLETGTVTHTRGGPCAFTGDSRWLVCVRPSVVEAVSLVDGRIVDLTDHFHRPTNGFALLSTAAAGQRSVASS